MPVVFSSPSRRLAVSLVCCLLLALALAPREVAAQTNVGRLSGTITDATGAVVTGASVTVTNAATNLVRTATTDADGFYTVTNLPVGTYVVAAESQGFKRAEQRGVALTADARLTVDMALEPGQVTETVQVSTALGETVNTTSGEVARVIDSQQVQNLALNGRNYIQLLSLIPGVAQTTDDQLELSTSLATNTQSINGNRGQMTNMTVDGGTNLQSGSNASQINNVGIDFIQEVKVQTSNFSAEYGRNSGAQVNVVTRAAVERVSRLGLRVPAQRQARRAQLLRARAARAPVQRLRVQLRGPHPEGQVLLLRRAGVEEDSPPRQPGHPHAADARRTRRRLSVGARARCNVPTGDDGRQRPCDGRDRRPRASRYRGATSRT